jgi:hypothetical protein
MRKKLHVPLFIISFLLDISDFQELAVLWKMHLLCWSPDGDYLKMKFRLKPEYVEIYSSIQKHVVFFTTICNQNQVMMTLILILKPVTCCTISIQLRK